VAAGVSVDPQDWHPLTRAVRGGLARSEFDETAEAIFLTSGFVYASAEQAEAAFKDEIDHYVYSRYGNPTVATFEERMRLLEGAEACFATASGMAAVFTAMAALCGQGDRVVASRALFGSCFVILDEILPRWGVETVFVDGADLDQWAEALSVPTTAVFFETPSNPMQDLVDMAAVSELAHRVGATVVVDNVFGTPVFSHPLDHGADVVVYSATKHIDGQGRALGGAVLGPREYVEGPVKNLMRHTGPSMSPFNAWIMTKGLETLELRVRRMAESALAVAGTLEGWQHAGRGINRVLYPHLPSHPQHALARRQLEGGGGTVVTVDLDGGKDTAFAFMNALQLVDISNNLGDAKSLTTHPATTTHRRLEPEARAAVGITDGTVRLSIGLEDVRDLVADLDQALARADRGAA
jgi:O-succinylhomoserine sulfhydrylase